MVIIVKSNPSSAPPAPTPNVNYWPRSCGRKFTI